MTGWTEQIAIVTGGSRGIGRAIARALAARGAAICINYATRADEAEAAAGEIAATGGRVIAFQADVADADAVARMVTRTDAELGPVSILVNNAGVSSPATLESYGAIGNQAARGGFSVRYQRLTRLLDELALARVDGKATRLLAQLARIQLLIIDDWAMARLTAEQRRDLMEPKSPVGNSEICNQRGCGDRQRVFRFARWPNLLRACPPQRLGSGRAPNRRSARAAGDAAGVGPA